MGDNWERRGRVKSWNVYKGPMDMDNRVEIVCEWAGGAGESIGR